MDRYELIGCLLAGLMARMARVASLIQQLSLGLVRIILMDMFCQRLPLMVRVDTTQVHLVVLTVLTVTGRRCDNDNMLGPFVPLFNCN